MNKYSRFFAALAGLILLALPASVNAQGNEQARITQVDSSAFPQVTVYVSVTGPNGEPVPVDASRLTLYENGKQIKPESVRATGTATGQSAPVTTLLVIDTSGSMNENGKLEAAKNAARAYVDQMRPGDQVGVLAFNDKVQYVQPVTSDKNALNTAIGKLTAQDNTAMYDALGQGTKTLASASGRKAIIALTDGMDNRSSTNADNVIAGIGPAGLTISTIGFGDPGLGTSVYAGLDEARLRSLADRAGGLYAAANDAASLRKIYEQTARQLQNEYAVTFNSQTSLRDGLNRSLTLSLAAANGAPVSAQGRYNPGGVVPESSKIPTTAPVFLIGMVALLALLLVPGALAWARARTGGQSRGGRIRMTDPSKPNGGGMRGFTSGISSFFSGLGKNKKPATPATPASRIKLSEPSQSSQPPQNPPRVRMR